MSERISSAREVEDLIKARYPLVYVVSSEEQRVEKALAQFALRKERKLFAWSITRGFVALAGELRGGDIKDPIKALDHIASAEGRGLYVLRDFHAYCDNPQVVRRLRDLAHELPHPPHDKAVVLLSPVLKVPPELEKEMAVIDWDLPARAEIDEIVGRMLPELPSGVDPGVAATSGGRERIVEAALGLTHVEAENVLAKSIVRTRTFDVATILGEKKHIIRKSGILEYYEAEESLDDIGGLEVLKAWLKKRRGAFTQKAREFGLPLPKGILLIGVPGCGKSLTAKAVGAAWQMPLLRLDVGKIFAGLVGSSEENIRKVIKTAEAIAPAVLWLDELEKGFSGTASSGMTDGGTTSRVFGTFITWLQEKSSPVFVIATANDVRSLPPELMRKGRFDEVFYVDLPSREERQQILEIHLRKKRRDPATLEVPRLVEAMIDFSGAEVEQAVVSALYDAFDRVDPASPEAQTAADLTTEDILTSVREIVPLAVTMKENIDLMRAWARSRARPASISSAAKDRMLPSAERKLDV
jgi:SpoVK/Ycf46/Vps4 family AAA+-type ATPase